MKRIFFCALAFAWGSAGWAGELRLSNERGAVEVDAAASGGVASWRVGEREVVKANALPALVLEGEGGSLPFRVRKTRQTREEGGWRLVLEGEFVSKEAVVLYGEVVYTVPEDFSRVEATVKLNAPQGGAPFAVHELAWEVALALEPRKRVFFQGEHGLAWDTTYFYQFHVDAVNRLLRDPERNEWRYVGLDQPGPRAFQIWKAEGDATPRLLMQEGREAAPFAQVYDARQGVAVEVPGLAATAPKRLRVDAAGGAALRLELWPRRQAPVAISSDAFRKAVLDTPHRIILHATQGEAALLALRRELTQKSKLAAAPAPEALLAQQEWIARAPRGDAGYVTGGYPFAKGEFAAGSEVAVRIGGERVPAQGRALAYWPDGSVKWLAITARLPEGEVATASAPPWVTFRDGRRWAFEAVPGKALEVRDPLQTRKEGGEVVVETGALRAVLGTGRRWLKALERGGTNVLATEEGVVADARYRLDFEALSSTTGRLEGGRDDVGSLMVNRVDVVEEGPLRSLVRLEGMVSNREPTRVLLWLEFRAGSAEIRITHTTEFLFADPRRTVLTGLGLELPVALGGGVVCRVPGVAEPVSLADGGQVVLEQLTPGFSEVVERREGVVGILSRGEESPGWLAASGEQGQVLAVCRNFWQMAPKALSIRRDGAAEGRLRVGLWPEEAAPMDVRRYSNYPHKSQSEALPDRNDTVASAYYAHEPFMGISRSHEVMLGFYAAGGALDAAARAADFESPPLLYAGWPRYEKTQVALPGYVPEAAPHGMRALENFTTFWRYHQALHRWYGFWNYGDFRHYFQDGYGWTLPPEKLAEALAREPGPDGRITLGPRDKVLSYQPANDWAYDNGRWGWGNTEGLPNLFLANQYFRTGDRGLYFASEALARHSRDVVIRHAGRWLGLGTRHGVQPWSDGNHEERQTSATEYKPHYFLSGEPRSREVVGRLYAHRYSNTPVAVDAAHSGRLQGLLFHWEVTGDPKEGETLRRYIHAMKAPEGIYEEVPLSFPGPEPQGPPKGLNKGSMFFHVFGAMHALLEYEMITRDPETRAMLLAAADSLLANPKAQERYPKGRYSPISYGPLGFAAREAKDPEPYRKFIRESFLGGGWRQAWQMVTANPKHWSGPSAHLGSSVPGSFFWMNFAPYMIGVVDEAELARPEVLQALPQREQTGNPKEFGSISLQNEYDAHPELEPYLRRDRPWGGHVPEVGAR